MLAIADRVTAMRRYIRHPSDIPIHYDLSQERGRGEEYLKDVGGGGLCFRARIRLSPGTEVHLEIPARHPAFEAEGVVAWCRYAGGGFEIGVRFPEGATEYALRMVEQICHIEQYRRDIRAREGRWLTSEAAAAEWIGKFAEDFPH